jgi:hypothetical protein
VLAPRARPDKGGTFSLGQTSYLPLNNCFQVGAEVSFLDIQSGVMRPAPKRSALDWRDSQNFEMKINENSKLLVLTFGFIFSQVDHLDLRIQP